MFGTDVPHDLRTAVLDVLDYELSTDFFALGTNLTDGYSGLLTPWATRHFNVIEAFHRSVRPEEYQLVREWYDDDMLGTDKERQEVDRIMNRSAERMSRILRWDSLESVPDVREA